MFSGSVRDDLLLTITKFVKDRWVSSLIFTTFSAHILIVVLTIKFTSINWPLVGRDPAVFQYGGWYINQGGVPYVDFWDVKPPLIYFLTSIIALLSAGDMSLLHNIGWIFSSSATVGTSLVIGLIVHWYTEDELSSLTAGVSLFILTQFYGLPRWGVYPQFFSTFFASISIYYLLKEDYVYVGTASVIAAGFYYPEGIIFILSTIYVVFYEDRVAIKQYTKGVLVSSIAIVLPLIYWGNLVPLVVETIMAPILTETAGSIINRFLQISLFLGPGILILPLVGFGWYQSTKISPKKGWIIGVGGLLYTFRILSLGPGSALQMMGWMVFAVIGIGLTISKMDELIKWASLASILVIIITSLAWTMPMFNLQPKVDPGGPIVGDPDVDRPGIKELYWNKTTSDYCHIRLSGREIQWIEMTDSELSDRYCGKWPTFIE